MLHSPRHTLQWLLKTVKSSLPRVHRGGYPEFGPESSPFFRRSIYKKKVVQHLDPIRRTVSTHKILTFPPDPPDAAQAPRKAVTLSDSELVYLGLTGKCEKWSRNKWVGSRELAHTDLWPEAWDRWQF